MSARDKKLINDPQTCVDDALQGLVAVNPGLSLLQGYRVVIRSDIDKVKASGKVTIISGGGSGHEPMNAGFVGPSALSAAVAGSVFTSPPSADILAAIQAVGQGNPAGTLVIVPSYTGDRLNFGLAAEKAKALGLQVQTVVVGEDCALTSADKTAGRRGLCGIILINKLAGALAEEGRSLTEVQTECVAAISSMGTIGLSLSPCCVPGSAGPSFQLPADEFELGLGVHGEAGVRRIKMLSAKEAVAVMLNHMTEPTSDTHMTLQKGDPVALMINNLGGLSGIEQYVVAKEAIEWLEQRDVRVERAYCGPFMTSLEMAGVSLTVMHLTDTRRRCLDAATGCPGWLTPCLPSGLSVRHTPKPLAFAASQSVGDGGDAKQAEVDEKQAALVQAAVRRACQAIKDNCEQLNAFDTSSGDGDCGSTLTRGADAMLRVLEDLSIAKRPAGLMHRLATVAETGMGGCSGAFYGLMLTAAARALQADVSTTGWCQALQVAVEAVRSHGGAEAGDRTMLDALIPANTALQKEMQSGGSALESFSAASRAAQNGALATIKMKAQAGRASYVSDQLLTQPDPGAHAVGIWMTAAYEACK